MSRVVKYPDGKVFLEATLAHDDLYKVNPMHFFLPEDDANSVTYNAMLTKVKLLNCCTGP